MPRKPAMSDTARVVAQYREQSLLYHDFCASLSNLLVSLLDSKRFKYQISSRIKSLDSVCEKIERNAAKGKFYRQLGDVEDLAGIRVVFYLESDKRRFLSALFKELTRDRLRVQEHHKERGYRSLHILARFGSKRLALSEYRRFAGLKCEIQLTSALYHAWSEVEHDILYKRDHRQNPLDGAAVLTLKRELDEAMAGYIQPASEILEAVARKVRRGGTHRALGCCPARSDGSMDGSPRRRT